MAIPLKRVLFFLSAVLVLHASPALSVPLSTGMNGQDAAAVSATGSTSPDGEATEQSAGIVDNQELALGANDSEVSGPHSAGFATGGTAETRVGAKSRGPGWLKPAAAVGGGASIFAILASGKGKDKGSGSSTGSSGLTLGSGGGGNASVGGDDKPPIVNPEPGTMLLMGFGIAGYLGRRKLGKK